MEEKLDTIIKQQAEMIEILKKTEELIRFYAENPSIILSRAESYKIYEDNSQQATD